MKKRSFWFTLVSLSLIIFALYWTGLAMVFVLGKIFPARFNDAVAVYLILLSFFYAFAGITAAAREVWSRRLVIMLSLAGILTIGTIAPFLHKGICAEAGIYKDGNFYRLREMKAKKSTSFLEGLSQGLIAVLGEGLERMGVMIGNAILGIIEAIAVLYLAMILFIFIRH